MTELLATKNLLESSPRISHSKTLEKDVQFWEKIFSVYDADQCVFHDEWNLDVIYFVADLPGNDPKRAQKIEKRTKRKIERALRRFTAHKPPRDWFERHVWQGIPSEKRTNKFFRHAATRVRCQKGIARNFRLSLQRSKKYLPMIRQHINQNNLPIELAYLPHLESGFNPKAHSRAGAKGLWQLMPATAKRYMRVDRHIDLRANPWHATKAAIQILKANYRATKSWPLAITAYNYGINGVKRAMKRLGTRSFDRIRKEHRSPIFQFAARNFFPSFLAVRNLAEAYEKDSLRKKPEKKRSVARRKPRSIIQKQW